MKEKNVLLKDLKKKGLFHIMSIDILLNEYWNIISNNTNDFNLSFIDIDFDNKNINKIKPEKWFYPIDIEVEAEINDCSIKEAILTLMLDYEILDQL